MIPAIFFDRDGILNEVVIRNEISSPRTFDEFRLKDGAAELLQTAAAAGFLRIVVTNQPDLDRGLLDPAELERMHESINRTLSPDAIEVCPASSPDDRRKKPNPGMLLDAAERLRIDLRKSWIVGDTEKDLEAGRRAGVGTILLVTDYNRDCRCTADHCFSSLSEIASFIRARGARKCS